MSEDCATQPPGHVTALIRSMARAVNTGDVQTAESMDTATKLQEFVNVPRDGEDTIAEK